MKGHLYRGGHLTRRPLTLAVGVLGLSMLAGAPASAQTGFNMDFEASVTPPGVVATNFAYPDERVRLATDNSGGFDDGNKTFGSPNEAVNSYWSGQHGGATSRTVTFNTVAGHKYQLGFDLFFGMSLDGHAAGGVPEGGISAGPDWFKVQVDGNDLLNTTFSNFNNPASFAAGYGQAYAPGIPIAGIPPTDAFDSTNAFQGGTGADVMVVDTDGDPNNNARDRYSIYKFQAAPDALSGNRKFEFTGTGGAMTLNFESYSYRPEFLLGWSNSNDEYWAIDNINVQDIDASVVPEPASMALLGSGILPVLGLVARRRKKK